jgi:RNA polymerase sigma-70 factor (ECF subfamily)
LITQQTVGVVRKILVQLPKRDQAILREIFWLETDKEEVCQKFGVGRDYLRVLVHRAKGKFRSAMGP